MIPVAGLMVLGVEESFHAALDAESADQAARAALADWLLEHDDPRAEGYQALVVLGLYPEARDGLWQWDFNYLPTWRRLRADPDCGFRLSDGRRYRQPPHVLPAVWLNAGVGYFPHPSRRTAEDAAAWGWGRLSRRQKVAILRPLPLAL